MIKAKLLGLGMAMLYKHSPQRLTKETKLKTFLFLMRPLEKKNKSMCEEVGKPLFPVYLKLVLNPSSNSREFKGGNYLRSNLL